MQLTPKFRRVIIMHYDSIIYYFQSQILEEKNKQEEVDRKRQMENEQLR